MSGKGYARLGTFVVVVWCLVMLGFISALLGAVGSNAGWGAVGGWFIPALALLVIGQALGILMERYRIDPDHAFQFLVRASSSSNIKLRDVADEIVTSSVESYHRVT